MRLYIGILCMSSFSLFSMNNKKDENSRNLASSAQSISSNRFNANNYLRPLCHSKSLSDLSKVASLLQLQKEKITSFEKNPDLEELFVKKSPKIRRTKSNQPKELILEKKPKLKKKSSGVKLFSSLGKSSEGLSKNMSENSLSGLSEIDEILQSPTVQKELDNKPSPRTSRLKGDPFL